MPSNREAYFQALSLNIPKSIIDFALKEVNGFDYLQLTKQFDDEIKDYALFMSAMKRYQNGEMIEYVFGKTYFLSNPFTVNKNVLIPRQETEQLVLSTVDVIKQMFGDNSITIADVCTGSGAIGISIAKALPQNTYFLTDISKEALRVAKTNVSSLLENVNIEFLEGDMLEPLRGKHIDVLVCNPPYISNVDSIEKRTWEQEPHLALLADPCTYFYEKVLRDYQNVMNEICLLAFEIGEDMVDMLTDLVKKYSPSSNYYFEKDLYGKTRFLFIKQL